MVEAVFDIDYLVLALLFGLKLLLAAGGSLPRTLAGIMALTLAFGDAFHLLPRIAAMITRQEEGLRQAAGTVTSITMTVFYLLLWQIGLSLFVPSSPAFWSYIVYLLAFIRILLCLLPQNKWHERYPPVSWGIIRNIPFFLLGLLVAGLFFVHRDASNTPSLMWLAIGLSFAFYLPVVLWANKKPKIGMLMLPKTCAYLWMLMMCALFCSQDAKRSHVRIKKSFQSVSRITPLPCCCVPRRAENKPCASRQLRFLYAAAVIKIVLQISTG